VWCWFTGPFSGAQDGVHPPVAQPLRRSRVERGWHTRSRM
ncbi:MAG: hypothetical protein AVDCRST_MAG89-1636, partial [uncultured Gemmatimonadetes bacterium]